MLSLSASPALGPWGIPDAGPDDDAAGADVVALDVVELGELEPPHAARARHMNISAPPASRLIDLDVAVLIARSSVVVAPRSPSWGGVTLELGMPGGGTWCSALAAPDLSAR